MASVAYGIHKASPAPPLQDLEILGPEIGNMPCIDLPEYGVPLHKQAASDGLAEMVGTRDRVDRDAVAEELTEAGFGWPMSLPSIRISVRRPLPEGPSGW